MGTVVVSGAVPNVSGLKISDHVAVSLAGDIALAADCDLCDLGTRLQIAAGATLNLNGHNLTVGGLAGDGTITAGLRDLTSPDPNDERVTQTGTFYGDTKGSNLFNDNYSRGVDATNRVIVESSKLPISVTYDFGAETPQKVDCYKIYCGAWEGNQTRGPKTWTFEGADDVNGTWTPLHSVDNETWDNTHEVRTYPVDNSTAYRYYRITFTASRTTYLELVQLEYFDTSLGNAAQGGELHVVVPQGVESTNSTVTIHGNVKLVKEGEGTFVGNKIGQAYSGGNLISEGAIKAMPNVNVPFGAGVSDVQVEPGAAYDFNGATSSYIYHFKMNGGKLTNTGAKLTATVAQAGKMTLLADSYMEGPFGLGFRRATDAPVIVDLAGHTLSISNDDTIVISATTFTNGVVRIEGYDGIPFRKGGHADTAELDIKGQIAVYDADVTVSNLLFRSGSITSSGDTTKAFKVSGTFKTETDDFPFVTMMDGSTLDLKDREGTFNAVSASSNSNGFRLRFAPNATVTIDVSGRTLSPGDQLIAWDEVPQNVTFQFDAATAEGGVEPVVTERGLLYGHDDGVVEQAWWTGTAGDGDIANPANWLCKNAAGGTVTGASALPSAVTHVYLEGALATNVPSLACRICTLTNATLAADSDLRGLGAKLEIAPNATVNLNGKKLYVSAASQIGTCTVSDAEPVDLTSPDTTGNHVTQTGTFYGSTVGANLFNDNYERVTDGTHRIIVETKNLPVSVTYDFGSPTLVDAYRIWTGPISKNTSRLPMRWKIEGSTDGADWALLDYRKGVSKYGDTNGHRTYSFDNTTAYSRYRITLEAPQPNHNNYLEAVQLEYFSLKATQGELHIDTTGVSGETEFAGLSLTGNMRLVKEGAGTIRLSKKYQGNVGGLVVLGGIVIPGADTATTIAAAYLGEMGSDIIVRGNNTGDAGAEDGVVKFNTIEGYTGYRYILDGGSLYDPGLANITDMRLDSDSWLKLTATTPKNGTNYVGRADTPSFIDLRGHTLSATIDTSGGGGKTLYLYNVTVDNGLVDVQSGGWFGSRGTIVATNNASFRVNCACDIQGEFYAKNYTYLQTSPNYNRGAGVVDVYGTFGMLVRVFHGTRLHDGSTIDFADYGANIPFPLPAVSVIADSQTGDKTLRFEPGVTIGVKLGERKVEKGTRIISWDAETAPDATVKFKSADAGKKYRFKKEADGLYYYPPAGFMLIVR